MNMKVIETKGQIVIVYKGIVFKICDLIQQMENSSFRYVYIPHYRVIDILPPEVDFEGIQGIDLELRLDKYVREGIPTFVGERVPPQTRVDLYKILEKNNLKYYEPMQLMILDSGKYCGDNLQVQKFIEQESVDIKLKGTSDLYKSVSQIVKNIALDNIVTIDNESQEFVSVFKSLYPVYLNLYDIKCMIQKNTAKNKGNRGRPQKYIKDDEFIKIVQLYKKKEISMADVLNILDISRSTFVRKMKLCQK